MATKDEEKTTFITDKDLYYYKVMPFSFKNVGATYQQLINKIIKHQIGRYMKVYINDVLVKSMEAYWYIANLEEALPTSNEAQHE